MWVTVGASYFLQSHGVLYDQIPFIYLFILKANSIPVVTLQFHNRFLRGIYTTVCKVTVACYSPPKP